MDAFRMPETFVYAKHADGFSLANGRPAAGVERE